MKNWILYRPLTGEIARAGSCTDESFESQAQAGLVLIEGQGRGHSHYVSEDGVVVAYTPEEIADKRDTWFPEVRVWGNRPPGWVGGKSLAENKVEAWSVVKARRDTLISEPKVTSVGTFDATPEDLNNFSNVLNIVELMVARGMPGVANYTLANNVREELTLAQLQQAALEMAMQVQDLHDQAYAMREDIDRATSKAQVNAVGWPT